MNTNERLDDHQKFKELAALAHTGALSESERRKLERHLQCCDQCRQAYDEYALISADGMNFLSGACGESRDITNWNDNSAREALFARIRTSETSRPAATTQTIRGFSGFVPPRNRSSWRAFAAAACVLAVVAVGAYSLGGRNRASTQAIAVAPSTVAVSSQPDKASDELLAADKLQLSRLQSQVLTGQQEVVRLQQALRSAEARVAALASTNAERNDELQRVSEQRDKLASGLREAQTSYQMVQAELTTLRAEHDRVLLRTTSLESKIDELNASAHDQERRLKDDEQYLASDRDIRELMGARRLYIADVFDVDSGSRTRKPFGRVFYTESKSLIFYAFDLDHQPGVKNASFQVWGQRDAGSGEKNHATNLGILYMDSETNRRWVLRLEDPKQLAEIDAVFVTVEPHGGSQKPTGKPFLYALLRREANHP